MQLGGTGIDEDGRYVLGDDALAVLKDIKRWLKLYDEKLNRLDVARCLAEANVVKGDILEILSAWPDDESSSKMMERMALSCLEVLVPLTWPLERTELQSTANHYHHTPYLQLAQIGYKREMLEHPSGGMLRTAIRVALPAIALPMSERNQRDEGIIKLVLYFLRNIAMISAPPNLAVEWNENEVSRSATIEAFQAQDVLALLLTIASNIGEDFNTQDVVVLELLFHICKGVDVDKLFMEDMELDHKNSKELQGLMAKEAAMLQGYSKNAPTRHNRFGTMIWVKRDDEKVSTVSGQDVLRDGQYTLSKMDQSKKWNKPKQRKKEQRTTNHFDLPTSLNKKAKTHLRAFVEDFLDSGFNPLFSHVRRAIERTAERVLESHQQQFLYLIGWFLQAERARKAAEKRQAKRRTDIGSETAIESYGLVASVLNQETFILLNKQMQDWLDHKLWLELDAGMRCFTQILLTVQEMSDSPLDEDQEIADNIQNRIFYEETTQDRVVTILRTYKDQNFSYLDACTDLVHVFLRMLERYAKENIDLQIRSRGRARKKKAAEKSASKSQDDDQQQDSEAEEDQEEANIQKLSRERKFEFTRFAAKFVTQPCVNTFVTFTTYYKDLSAEQLKRAHRYFYRVAFKQEMSVMLFRLDILSLFHRMIKGPEGLNTACEGFEEWQELAKQVFRRFIKKMQERPGLAVEVLFSKISSTAFYLENGYEKEAVVSTSRAPAELEVKGDTQVADQLAVVVAVLSINDMDHVVFAEDAILASASERKAWEASNSARAIEAMDQDVPEASSSEPPPPEIILKPDNEARRIALFKNPRFRLLLRLSGLQRRGEADDSHASWYFPSDLSSSDLQTTADIIATNRKDPRHTWGEDNALSAEDMLQRRYALRETNNIFSSDDEDNMNDADDIDALVEQARLLPTNKIPPTRTKKLLKRKKSKKRPRSDDDDDDDEDNDSRPNPADEEAARSRRIARLLADISKRQKIKSAEFIHDSDEEGDTARDQQFFDREEAYRTGQAKKVMELLMAEKKTMTQKKVSKKTNRSENKNKKQKQKRRSGKVDVEAEEGEKENAPPPGISDEDDDLDVLLGPPSSVSKDRNSGSVSSGDDQETPLSSRSGSPVKLTPRSRAPFAEEDNEYEDVEMGTANYERAKTTALAEIDIDSEVDIISHGNRTKRRRTAILDDSDED